MVNILKTLIEILSNVLFIVDLRDKIKLFFSFFAVHFANMDYILLFDLHYNTAKNNKKTKEKTY